MRNKTLGFLAVLAVALAFGPTMAQADDNCDSRAHRGVRVAGHVTKVVVVRVPVVVLETGGDVVRVTGDTVGTACDNVAGLWSRTGHRAFGLFRRCHCHH